MSNNTEQEKIANWFNSMYSKRGEMYLRPVKAYYIFLELLKVQKGNKILDVASGLGRLLEAADSYNLELHGFDISEVAVEKSIKKLPHANIQVANAEKIPYENGTFDFVTCLGSLERMINLPAVLDEIYRTSKKEARICFLVRNNFGFTWGIKRMLGIVNKKGHQGAKSLEEWTAIFNHSKFNVVEVYADQYPIKKRQKFLSLGLMKINYKKLSTPLIPLKYVHEYIFILNKK